MKIREIKSGIMVRSMEKGKELMGRFRIEYGVVKGCLKLKSVKEGLTAFICCEDEKLEPEFVELG